MGYWDKDDFIFFGVVVVLIVLSVAVFWVDSKEWSEFSEAHQCRKVAEVQGKVAPTLSVGGKGQVAMGNTYISGSTGYLCDDGITYWR